MPKTIAIIDDEIEMEFIYSLMLEEIQDEHKIQLKFFSDARRFESWLEFNRPDLILSDINMPYLSGIELGHRIRKAGHITPTYFISGDCEEIYHKSLKDVGPCRYLTKPIDFKKMKSFIKADLAL